MAIVGGVVALIVMLVILLLFIKHLIFYIILYHTQKKDKINLNNILEEFLSVEKITFQQIRRNKEQTIKFISYLNLYEGRFSKKELSDVLQIGRTTLYRWLKE